MKAFIFITLSKLILLKKNLEKKNAILANIYLKTCNPSILKTFTFIIFSLVKIFEISAESFVLLVIFLIIFILLNKENIFLFLKTKYFLYNFLKMAKFKIKKITYNNK